MRRLRAVLASALVWGAGWFTLAMVVFAGQQLSGHPPAGDTWLTTFQAAAKFGVLGTIAGAGFAGFIAARYRGRRLSDINGARFGLRGGIVAALAVPLFMDVARLLSGEGLLPVGKQLGTALVAAVLGAAVAAGTLKLAQLGERLLPDSSRGAAVLLEAGDRSEPVGEWKSERREAPARSGGKA